MSARNQIPILTYHSIDDSGSVISLDESEFEHQIASLRSWGYRSLSLLEAVRRVRAGKALPERHVILTFDDGFRNNLTLAAPILLRYGYSATVFITTAYTGTENSWPRQHESIPRLPRMTAPELREIRSAGIELGAHTHSHPFLAELEPAAARVEIQRSKEELESHLGEAVPLFSYPYGSFHDSAHNAAAELFEGAISIRLGRMRADGDLYAIERINAAGGLMRKLPFGLLATSQFGTYLALKRTRDWLKRGLG